MSLIQNIQKIGDKLVASFKGGGQQQLAQSSGIKQFSYSELTFGAASGAWTVSSTAFKYAFYTITGNVMSLWLGIENSDIDGTPAYIYIDLPSNFKSKAPYSATMLGYANNFSETGTLAHIRFQSTPTNPNRIYIYKQTGAISSTSNATTLFSLVSIPLESY